MEASAVVASTNSLAPPNLTSPVRMGRADGNVVALHAERPRARPISPAVDRPFKLRRTLVATDAAASATAWLLVLGRGGDLPLAVRVVTVTAMALLTVGLMHAHQLYLARISRVRSVEVARLARVAVLAGAIAYLAGGRIPMGMTGSAAVHGAILSFLALATSRSAYTSWVTRLRSRGYANVPVVVVGDNEEGQDLRRHLESHPELGFVVVAMASAAADVEALLHRHGAASVVIAVTALTKSELNDLARRLLDAGVHVHLSCGLAGVDHRRLRRMPLAHEPLFYLERTSVTGMQRMLSRGLDIVGSIAGLLVTAPVLAAAAVAVKLEDRGRVLFRQERIGRDGRPFTLYKLRTMVPDAESRLASVQASNLRDGPLFKAGHDARVTAVGRWLRATSIDELPQLANVLRGSMSLVGPRPALAREVAQFDAELLTRHRVKPGITGLWQVEARQDPSFAAYRRLDLYYIENWSLVLDVVILLRTVKGLAGQAWRDLGAHWRPARPSNPAIDATDTGSAVTPIGPRENRPRASLVEPSWRERSPASRRHGRGWSSAWPEPETPPGWSAGSRSPPCAGRRGCVGVPAGAGRSMIRAPSNALARGGPLKPRPVAVWRTRALDRRLWPAVRPGCARDPPQHGPTPMRTTGAGVAGNRHVLHRNVPSPPRPFVADPVDAWRGG